MPLTDCSLGTDLIASDCHPGVGELVLLVLGYFKPCLDVGDDHSDVFHDSANNNAITKRETQKCCQSLYRGEGYCLAYSAKQNEDTGQ